MTADGSTHFRLPHGAVPTTYRLRLEPDLEALSFRGNVEIVVELSAATNVVVLNAADLEIEGASANLSNGATRIARPLLDAPTERLSLHFDDALPAGVVVLRVTFAGVINDDLRGFYRSTFTDPDGHVRTIATSQLALTDARRAFPCFDEPALKATFEVTLVAPAGLEAVSNARVIAEAELPDGRREVSFAPTIKMSTYLVAFAVGPFEATEPIEVDGVAVRVLCPLGRSHLARYARDAGAFALRFYAEYFDIPYPGDKLDLVAIPDFAFGAMENLGCVMFREEALLVDPTTASTVELQRVATTVAHEITHMWFGDLVTMAWWEGIWLNEAFATFLTYHCADELHPEWHVWVQFAAACEAGLSVDALHSTRPIEFPVASPSDAMGMIDTITYEKGGSVLRMLEQYLGADVYRDGIRRYLRRHAYANTVTSDLWEALEEVSGQPVGAIMDSWILQGGHPVVTSSGGVLAQAPFQFGPPTGDSNIGSSWQIPVHSRPLDGGATTVQLLGTEPAPLDTPHPAVVNAGGTGVFRTNYDTEELEAIAGQLGALDEIERAVLLADTRALALAGERSVHDFVLLAGSLGTVVEPEAWDTVEDFLELLDLFIADEDRPALQTTAKALFEPLLERLGWDESRDKDERARHVRATAVRCLGCVAQDASTRAEAVARFDAGVLEGDLAESVIVVVASMARPGDLDEMLRRLRSADSPQAERRYRRGITSLADPAAVQEAYGHCFEWFRGQDAPFVVAELMANRAGGAAVWEALSFDFDGVLAQVPPLMQSILCAGIPSLVADRALAERITMFHNEHPLATGQRQVEQYLERMLNRVAFAERVRPTLREALS